MKILRRTLDKEGAGEVKIEPEDTEDLWHAYHLVSEGDVVTASTQRKVANTTSTGSTTQERVRLVLSILVDGTQLDLEAGQLRVRGRVAEEHKHVRRGQFHTLELVPHRALTLRKPRWDALHLRRLTECAAHSATQSASHSTVALVAEPGLANLCSVLPHATTIISRIERALPKKRSPAAQVQHARARERFLEDVASALAKSVNPDDVACVVVATPAHLGEDVLTTFQRAYPKEYDSLKSKIVTAHCSSGHIQSVQEALRDPAVAEKVQHTRAAKQVRALDLFLERLHHDPDRAQYGYAHVSAAVQLHAVETLLVSDGLVKSADVPTRQRYSDLVEAVEGNAGEVLIFSALHQSGQQLDQISGIAALLRFPLAELDDVVGSSSSDNDDAVNLIEPNRGSKSANDANDSGKESEDEHEDDSNATQD